MISRREWMRITAAVSRSAPPALAPASLAPAKEATVYKDAQCGCCKKCGAHAEERLDGHVA
jgi:hypothetical protein